MLKLKWIIPIIVGVFSYFIIKYDGNRDYKGRRGWTDKAGNFWWTPREKQKSFFH